MYFNDKKHTAKVMLIKSFLLGGSLCLGTCLGINNWGLDSSLGSSSDSVETELMVVITN